MTSNKESSRKPQDHELIELAPVPVTWIRLAAGAATLIGAAGLIALLAQGAWAQTNPGGFKPGAKTFSNPFLNKAQGDKGKNFFDDEEDDLGDDGSPGAAPARPGTVTLPAHPGGSSTGGKEPNIQYTAKGISVGGGTPGGVISHNDVQPIKIDTETGVGEGSKEVVTDFNFPDVDILDLAKTMGKLTGKNFILDKDVKGRITILSNTPITVGDAWRAFLTALEMTNFALLPEGKYIRIIRQRDARDKHPSIYLGDYSPDTDAIVTRIFSIKYISAEEVARVFRSIMPPNARIIPYEQTNTLIVTDTGTTIAKIAKLLEVLDIEGYDAGIEVIPVKYASAADLAKLIDQLLPGTAAPTGPRIGGFRPGGSSFTARRTKEGGIINTIIADERTNSLIVHANAKGADQIRELVAKLDLNRPPTSASGKVHVVYLQFADAEQIATTLNNITAGGASRPSGPAGMGTGINPVSQSLFEGNIKVAPDKSTNSLVITADPADFVTVQRVINKLDIPRDQVYVEAVIMEISMNRDFTFSTNIINPSSGIGSLPNGTDLANFLANPIAQKGLVLGFKAGKSTNVTIGNQTIAISSVQGLVKALQTHNQANVLATPQILTLDNTEATFENTEKIPVPTTTAIQGSVSTAITYQPVSLKIKIKPQINKMSNFVKLDIETQLADVINEDLPSQVADLARATLERDTKTSIVVADADTAVLGGLIRDDHGETVSKIPILGDIPVLGWLFKSKTASTKKTNLLVFITPHIVKQYESIRAILDKKLRQRDEFIESAAGGEDPERKYRDDLIRSLPDIKDISAKQPARVVTLGNDEDETQSQAPSQPQAPAKQEGTQSQAPAPEAPTTTPANPPGADALPPAAPDASAAPAPAQPVPAQPQDNTQLPPPPPAGG